MVVGILSDEVILDETDNALRAMLLPMCRAMDRLFDMGFTPVGDMPTLIYASGIFVWRYNECRDEGVSVQDSLKIAQGSVLSHSIVNRYLAQRGYIIINQQVGVE